MLETLQGVAAYITAVTVIVVAVSQVYKRGMAKLHEEIRAENSTQAHALQLVLRAHLLEMIRARITQGYCPMQERSEIIELYMSYHSLGANGVIDDTMSIFKALPDKPGEKGAKNGDSKDHISEQA